MHDGNFGAPATTFDHSLDEPDHLDGFGGSAPVVVDDVDEKPSSVPSRVFQLDHLQLSPMDDTDVATIAAAAVAHIPSDSMASASQRTGQLGFAG